MRLEVLLELVSGDIVGMKRHQEVLRTLLSSPAGEWRELRRLDPTDALTAECRNYSPDMGPRVLDGLRLAWTPHRMSRQTVLTVSSCSSTAETG
jgi:hypothetical protein